MLMMFIIVYAFGIAMHSFMKEDEDLYEYWGTIGRCMMTLVGNGVFGDSIGTVMRGIARTPAALTTFGLFVLLSAITVTNMLIGVLCEVVGEVAAAEKEHSAIQQLKSTLLIMLKHLDEDGSGAISQEELLHVMEDESALAVFISLEVDVDYFIELQDMVYDNATNGERTIPQIMELILNSRGNQATTVKDVVDMHSFTRWAMKRELSLMQDELKGYLSEIIVLASTPLTVQSTIESTIESL
jgi:hypothetical protein